MKIARWKVNSASDTAVQAIMSELGLSRLAATALASRGIDTADLAREYLKKDISMLHDPFLLPDMDKAVERIQRAIEKGEKITVYGDYDVDGITATYILSDYLKSCGASCDFYIPDRIDEGYGVNLDAIDKLMEKGTTLIVTVDTGITAFEAVNYAKDQGCDVVITDHHECRENLPEACAVVNPARADSKYPTSEIAGVCVSYKLICALSGKIEEKYLPFVCIGTIADVMPLKGENRAIVAKGLEMIGTCDHVALCALLDAAGMRDKEITAESIGFGLAPRMNAAGRMKNASLVVELLYEKTAARAIELSQGLCDLNRERQAEEKRIFDEAIKLLPTVYDDKKDCAIVLAGDNWHHGVIGIVASRLSAKFNCPAILLTKDGDLAKGSGRGVPGINLYEVLSGAAHLFTQYGGHEMAIGLTLPCENVDALRRHINDSINLDEIENEIYADFEVAPEHITVSEIEGLSVLEPFGTGNAQPLIFMGGLRVERITPIGKGRHLRLSLSRFGAQLEGIYFNATVKDLNFTDGDTIDVLFNPKVNDFRGKSPQLVIAHARINRDEIEEIRKADELYGFVRAGSAFTGEFQRCNPTYHELGVCWRAMSSLAADGAFPLVRLKQLTRISYEKIFVALDVFEELKLLNYGITNLMVEVKVLPREGKADLENSKILQEIAIRAMG